MSYSSKRKKRYGYCAICGNYDILTADHVPPKGSVGINEVEMQTLSQYYESTQIKPKFSQNGVKFNTICGICNNERLGTTFDPYLKEISKRVASIFRTKESELLILPDELRIDIVPQRVARAIVGHLLAATPPEMSKSPPIAAPFSDTMRQYFLDTSLPLPNEIEIYYWLYPQNIQVILRSFGIGFPNSTPPIVCDCIKFFPLGYCVAWNKPVEATIHLPKLITNNEMGLDESATIRISFKDWVRLDWPEQPEDHGVNYYNEEMTTVATPRIRRK